MIKYTATNGERIDSIVHKHYGTLEPLAAVIAMNAQLDAILNAGDIVLLPAYEIKPKEIRLW